MSVIGGHRRPLHGIAASLKFSERVFGATVSCALSAGVELCKCACARQGLPMSRPHRLNPRRTFFSMESA
jgi:hypothetical protein